MIGFLRGQVITTGGSWMLLDVSGVGYEVFAPSRLIDAALVEQEQAVFTHLVVREDSLTLYGFASRAEKELFQLLIDISGIGPKIALAILSTYTPAEVQQAAVQQNAAVFSAVSGIGKKNAERIVLELKNKSWGDQLPGQLSGSGPSGQLQSALSSLGYSSAEVVQMSKQVDPSLPLSEQIKQALAKQS
jgi:Holliday junction DNA helicase RuvA